MAQVPLESIVIFTFLIALFLGVIGGLAGYVGKKLGSWLSTTSDGVRVSGLFLFGFVVSVILIFANKSLADYIPAAPEDTATIASIIMWIGIAIFVLICLGFYFRYKEDVAVVGGVARKRYNAVRKEASEESANEKQSKKKGAKVSTAAQEEKGGTTFIVAIFGFAFTVFIAAVLWFGGLFF